MRVAGSTQRSLLIATNRLSRFTYFTCLRVSGVTAGDDGVDKESVPVVTSAAANALPPPEILEQIIKSPPEPTRVKSPEQIIMRSPDPVNWTVPLDTGKTFTVTQNVRDGNVSSIVLLVRSDVN